MLVNKKSKQSFAAFTIVELLVVIVIIAILSALVTVTYTGITSKANVATLSSDLENAAKILKIDQVTNMNYPTTLAAANGGSGVPASPGTTYIYAMNNNAGMKGFCLAATRSGTTYKITNNDSPVQGDCQDYGLVLGLDAGNTSSYPGSGATWTDLSTSGHNATLSGGYSYNGADGGGTMTFDGVNGIANYNSGGFLPTGASSRTIVFWFKANAGMSASNGAFSYGCNAAEIMGCSDQGNGKYVDAYAYTSTIGLHLETCQVSGVTTPAPTSGWHLFTAVFNGDNTVTFYVDGGVNTVTRTSPCAIDSKAGVGYAVGVGRWGYYSGSISKLSVFNRPMNSDEVSQIFNLQRSRYGF